jgi:hypothetical protein
MAAMTSLAPRTRATAPAPGPTGSTCGSCWPRHRSARETNDAPALRASGGSRRLLADVTWPVRLPRLELPPSRSRSAELASVHGDAPREVGTTFPRHG